MQYSMTYLICQIMQGDSMCANRLSCHDVMQVGSGHAFATVARWTWAVFVDDIKFVCIFGQA